MRVFELSRKFPVEEKYSLTDQIRRSSRSVAANIAEAWRKRRYPNSFLSKLNDAEGEASETQTWTEFAERCRYVSEGEATELRSRYDGILRQLVTMINRPDQWCSGIALKPMRR